MKEKNAQLSKLKTALENTSKRLVERNGQLSKITLRLESTLKQLEQTRRANKILQLNISKLFNSAKVENNLKINRIIALERQLDKLQYQNSHGISEKKSRIDSEKSNRSRRSRSCSRQRENRRKLPSRDLRHRIRDYDKVRRSPENNKFREQRRPKDYTMETKKLLDMIRKNQTKGSPTSSEHSYKKKRDFLKELGEKTDTGKDVTEIEDITTEDEISKSKEEEVTCLEQDNTDCIDLFGPEAAELGENVHENLEEVPNQVEEVVGSDNFINIMEVEKNEITTEENNYSDSKTSDDINQLYDDNVILLEDAEISNDIFDELTQILNEINEVNTLLNITYTLGP